MAPSNYTNYIHVTHNYNMFGIPEIKSRTGYTFTPPRGYVWHATVAVGATARDADIVDA